MEDDIMRHLPEMEVIDSGLMERVLSLREEYRAESVTPAGVKAALSSDTCGADTLVALLSPAAGQLLEAMAERAAAERKRFFGNSVTMFTPLYIANYCENGCLYCGFSRGE